MCELERAAARFGQSIGGSGLRILAVLATLIVGQTLPGGGGSGLSGGAASRGKAARPPSGAAPPPARSVLEIPRAEIWQMPSLERGRVIEDVLAATEYKGWYRVGAERKGKFPVADFQRGRKVVSLKTGARPLRGSGPGQPAVVTASRSSSWLPGVAEMNPGLDRAAR